MILFFYFYYDHCSMMRDDTALGDDCMICLILVNTTVLTYKCVSELFFFFF